MRFGALNRGRHNSTLKPRARSADRWSGVHAIDAWISDALSIQRPALIHVPAIKTTVWDFSPTQKRLKKKVGFIRPDDLMG